MQHVKHFADVQDIIDATTITGKNSMSVISIKQFKFSNKNKLSKLAYCLGSLFGDGCLYHNDRGRIIFSSCDKEFTEILVKYLEELFKIKLKIRIDRLSLKNIKWKDAYIFSSRPLFKILEQFSNKQIPEFILNGDVLIKASFLRGFFDAEGNVNINIIKNRGEIQRRVSCFSNNKKMLENIKSMLEHFYIKSCITKSKGNNYRLIIWNYQSIYNYKKYINFNILRKREKLKKAIQTYKQIQTRWSNEVYNLAMYIRLRKNYGSVKIHKILLNYGFNVHKPTIEAWIYRKIKRGETKMTENADNIVFVGKNF